MSKPATIYIIPLDLPPRCLADNCGAPVMNIIINEDWTNPKTGKIQPRMVFCCTNIVHLNEAAELVGAPFVQIKQEAVIDDA